MDKTLQTLQERAYYMIPPEIKKEILNSRETYPEYAEVIERLQKETTQKLLSSIKHRITKDKIE